MSAKKKRPVVKDAGKVATELALQLYDVLKEMPRDEIQQLLTRIEEEGTGHEDGQVPDSFVFNVINEGLGAFE